MAQLVEHNLAKVGVAGSSPVVRSKRNSPTTTVAGFFVPVVSYPLLGLELFSNYSKIVLAFGLIIPYIKSSQADMAQLVEHNLAKVGVAGSSPVVRSIWAFSSGGERFPDTEEVRSSNLLTPTKCSQLRGYVLWAVLFWSPNGSPNRRQKVPRFMKERF